MLKQFGATVFEDLDPADFQAVLDFCNTLLAKGNATDKPKNIFGATELNPKAICEPIQRAQSRALKPKESKMPTLKTLELSHEGHGLKSKTIGKIQLGPKFKCMIQVQPGAMFQTWMPTKPDAGELPTRYGRVFRKAMREVLRAHAGAFGMTRGMF